MPHIDSDHLPLFLRLCHQSAAAAAQEGSQPSAADLEAAEEAIAEGREEAREE